MEFGPPLHCRDVWQSYTMLPMSLAFTGFFDITKTINGHPCTGMVIDGHQLFFFRQGEGHRDLGPHVWRTL